MRGRAVAGQSALSLVKPHTQGSDAAMFSLLILSLVVGYMAILFAVA